MYSKNFWNFHDGHHAKSKSCYISEKNRQDDLIYSYVEREEFD